MAVTDKNTLDIGLYEAIVTRADYFMRKQGMVDLRGSLTIVENDEKFDFSFSSNEKNFVSSYSYHNIFTDKEKAIEFHNENIHSKLVSMQERIIKLDSVSKNKPK